MSIDAADSSADRMFEKYSDCTIPEFEWKIDLTMEFVPTLAGIANGLVQGAVDLICTIHCLLVNFFLQARFRRNGGFYYWSR